MPSIKLPTVDLAAYNDPAATPAARRNAATALVSALHTSGFVGIANIGMSPSQLQSAFQTSKSLFALPHSEKMKAPHPAAAMPHRGYSAPGLEKVYSNDEVHKADGTNDHGAAIRGVKDYKESYEIGADDDPDQQNIWLPDDVLPGFRSFTTEFYWACNGVANTVLAAIADGLGLTDEAGKQDQRATLLAGNSQNQNQLRLLHYPPVEPGKLEAQVMARMPAHTDWGCCTMLWQEDVGGLELQDSKTGEWLPAEPEKGLCIFNVGDFLEGLTNGYFKSATHRVTLPQTKGSSGILPERYSIPYFIGPKSSAMRAPLATFITDETPSKYEAMTFAEYATWRSKFSY